MPIAFPENPYYIYGMYTRFIVAIVAMLAIATAFAVYLASQTPPIFQFTDGRYTYVFDGEKYGVKGKQCKEHMERDRTNSLQVYFILDCDGTGEFATIYESHGSLYVVREGNEIFIGPAL